MDPSGYTWLSRAWKWVKKFWQPSVVFGLYGGLKYDEGKQKGYSDSEAWLYAGVQTAITAIAAYAGTYVGAKVSAMLPFGGFWGGFVTGSAGAYASIFINYFGNNLLNGRSIWDSYWIAQKNAHVGAIVGGVISGIISGLGAYFDEQKRMADENLDLMGTEMNDKQLINHAKALGIEPGQNGLNELSTENVPRGYTFNESTRLYVDPEGNSVYGVTQRSFWTGKANIYISPYATRNEMLLNATLIHENAHVLQYYTGVAKAWEYDKTLMERNALVHELNYYNGLNRTNSLLWRYFRDNTLKHLLKLNY